MFSKFLKHARQGTLLRAAVGKVLGRYENDEFIAKAYRGDTAAGYVEERIKQKNWHIEQSIIYQLLSDVPDGSSVLDVPFGTGRFVGMYLQKGMIIYGLDISKDMLLSARQVIGPDYDKCHLHIGRADSLPFSDAKFDLIICCRFLGLISYPMANRVLSELNRVSKSRVILFIQVRKNVFSFPHFIDRLLCLLGIAPRYFRVMGGNIEEDRFLRLLGETGFRVLDRRVIVETPKTCVAFYVVSKQYVSPRLGEVDETIIRRRGERIRR